MTLAEIKYPADVIRELDELRDRYDEAVTYLFKLETECVELEIEADRQYAQAVLNAEGTVEVKKAYAEILSIDAKKAAELAKVKVNYAKNRIKQLSEVTSAVQTASKMIEAQMRNV